MWWGILEGSLEEVGAGCSPQYLGDIHSCPEYEENLDGLSGPKVLPSSTDIHTSIFMCVPGPGTSSTHRLSCAHAPCTHTCLCSVDTQSPGIGISYLVENVILLVNEDGDSRMGSF